MSLEQPRFLAIVNPQEDFSRVEGLLAEHGILASITPASSTELGHLLKDQWDLFLLEHSPEGPRISALISIIRARQPTAPIIVLSEAIGDEAAVSLLREGATDFVLESNLPRLVPAVQRALREARTQQESEVALRALQESELRFRLVMESTGDLLYDYDIASGTIVWSGRIDEMLGYPPDGFDRSIDGWAEAIDPEDRPVVVEALRRHVEENAPFIVEYRVRRRDGEVLYWSDRGKSLRDATGKPLRMIGAITDITAARRINEALRTSERLFRRAEMLAGVGTFEWNRRTGVLKWSEQMYKLFGVEPDTTLNIHEATHAIPAEDLEEVMASIEKAGATGKPTHYEHRLLLADGQTRFMVGVAELRFTDEIPEGIVTGVLMDQTEQIEAKRMLELRQERLELIAQVTASTVGDAPLAEQARIVAEQVVRAFRVDACVVRSVEGDLLPLLASVGIPLEQVEKPIPSSVGIAGMMIRERRAYAVNDVRHDKVTQALYQESKPTHYNFLAFAGAPLVHEEQVLGLIGIYMKAEPHAFTEDDRNHLQIVANHLAVMIANDRLFRQVRQRTEELEVQVVERTRAERRLEQQVARLRLLHTITHATTEQHTPAEIYKTVLQHIASTVSFACFLEYHPHGRVLVAGCSGRLEDLGVTRTPVDGEIHEVTRGLLEGEGQGGLILTERDMHRSQIPWVRELGTSGKAAVVATPLFVRDRSIGAFGVARPIDQPFTSAEAEFFRQLAEHVALVINQGSLYEEIQRAYSDLKASQAVLMQRERLRAMGEMASGIAHDINNALAPVIGYPDLILHLEKDMAAQSRNYLSAIQTAGRDIADTVSRLSLFYRERSATGPMEPVMLNTVAREVVDITRPRWRDMQLERGVVISIDIRLDETVPPVMAIRGELRTALTNLIFNAVDAMPNGGTLTIATATRNGWGIIEVTDTGTGMDEETLQRCLEPFYTTKGERGTGLGLPMVYGTVKRFSGDIEIESAPGVGTTLRLLLPVPERNSGTRAATADLRPEPMLRRRILYVDDDRIALEAATRLLTELGQEVLPCEDPIKALECFARAREAGHPFDVVISDLGMPHMDGRELTRRIREIDGSVPIALATGWGSTTTYLEHSPESVVNLVIPKPFSLREISAALRKLIPRDAASVPPGEG